MFTTYHFNQHLWINRVNENWQTSLQTLPARSWPSSLLNARVLQWSHRSVDMTSSQKKRLFAVTRRHKTNTKDSFQSMFKASAQKLKQKTILNQRSKPTLFQKTRVRNLMHPQESSHRRRLLQLLASQTRGLRNLRWILSTCNKIVLFKQPHQLKQRCPS